LLQEHDWEYLSNNTNKAGYYTQKSIALNLGGLSEFIIHCVAGHYKNVQDMIISQSVKNGKSLQTLIQLLEKRETSLRLSPLLFVVAAIIKLMHNKKTNTNMNSHNYDDFGAPTLLCKLPTLTSLTSKSKNGDDDDMYAPKNNFSSTYPAYINHLPSDAIANSNRSKTKTQWEYNLLKVVQILLEYGARPDARDIIGRTVVHYGAGIYATDVTLEIVTMCINASRSSFMFGKEIEIRHFSNPNTSSSSDQTDKRNKQSRNNNKAMMDWKQYNGKRGIAQGYIVETGCRIVYLFGYKNEVRTIKPNNIKLCQKIIGMKPTKLCDTPDRMGRVPILELYEHYCSGGCNNNNNKNNHCDSSHHHHYHSNDWSKMNNMVRLDVVEYLLFQHSASIDVPVGWGIGDCSGSSNTSTPMLLRELVIQQHHHQQQQQVTSNSGGGILLQGLNHTKNKSHSISSSGGGGGVATISPIVQLLYHVAIQKMKQEQKMKRNHCSQCQKVGTMQQPLRTCEPWYVYFFFSTFCHTVSSVDVQF
jgi:hypothetical protein